MDNLSTFSPISSVGLSELAYKQKLKDRLDHANLL